MGVVIQFGRVNPKQLQEYLSQPELLEKELPEGFDLDKTWHILHFLMTGTAYKVPFFTGAGTAILGGKAFGKETGDAPPRYLTPGQVRKVADGLMNLSFERIWARYDQEKMKKLEIYFYELEKDETKEYIEPYYRDMVEYYRSVAEAGDAMLIFTV